MTPRAAVLVHGTRTSGSQWDLQMPSLLAAGYTVTIPDLPGHGDRRDEPFTLDAAVATILEAVDTAAAVTGAPVHLVGSSLGGMLAIHAATHAQSDLASLTVCGAAVQPTVASASAYASLISLVDRLPGGSSGTSPVFRLLLGADGARAYLRGGRSNLDTVAAAFDAVAALDLRADLSLITVPVTFLHGRCDQLRLQEKSFAAAAAHGRLEVLPYGTHMVNLNRSHRFNADLLRVLARSSTPPTLGS